MRVVSSNQQRTFGTLPCHSRHRVQCPSYNRTYAADTLISGAWVSVPSSRRSCHSAALIAPRALFLRTRRDCKVSHHRVVHPSRRQAVYRLSCRSAPAAPRASCYRVWPLRSRKQKYCRTVLSLTRVYRVVVSNKRRGDTCQCHVIQLREIHWLGSR